MKKLYFLIVGLVVSFGMQAQVEKTLEITSGNLSSLLTEEGKSTLTNLILIGTVDARDFIATSKMPLLTSLDLSQTQVTAIDTIFDERVAISHPDTIGSYGYNPRESGSLFSNRLTSLKLPSSLKAIGVNGLSGCSSLTTIEIPSTVTSIGLYAFWGCTGLASITIPSSVTYIENYAFFGCNGLKELTISPSIGGINQSTFSGCSSLRTLTIPSPIGSIGMTAFMGCTELTSVILPESLKSISFNAFLYCPAITSIYSYNPIPPALEGGSFDADKSVCVVYVPYGSGAAYSVAEGWQDFENIVEELPGFTLSATTFNLELAAQSMTVELNSQTAWTAHSDQSWLTISPLSGNGSQTLNLSAVENTTYASRTAVVTVSISDAVTKDITVVQKGITNTVHLETAGTLATQLTEQELSSITNLTITGVMDARDFKTIREKMPVIATLDISNVSIEAYTNPADQMEYPANSIPFSNPEWFGTWDDHSLSDKTTLTTVLLPASLTGIEKKAFEGCTGLQKIEIPPLVPRIGEAAFYGCSSLEECIFPSSVSYIGMHAFYGCSSLSRLELPPKLPVIDNYTFSGCSSLVSITIPESVITIRENAFSYCSSLQAVNFSHSLTTIDNYAFYKCTGLLSVNIPSSVTAISASAFGGCNHLINLYLPKTLKYIGPEAFGNCTGLIEINSYAPIPIPLPALKEAEPGVFSEIIPSIVTLYVPVGSKALYQKANQWKDFSDIVEKFFPLSTNLVTLEAHQGKATVDIDPGGQWGTGTDDSWLTVSPSSGSGKATITVTAQDNATNTSRLGKVTISNSEVSQDVTVVQKGRTISDTIDVETAGTLYTYLPDDKLADISHLTLTGEIDARDFKLIRDRMPFLEVLDLAGASIKAYSGAEGTDEYTTDYHEDEVPAKAFENSFYERKSRLTSIVLPQSVTAIREEAFSQCRALKDIEIPPSVTSISYYAFAGCTSITEMIIPSSVTTIGIQVFRGCKSLKNIVLPSSITEFGNAAFEACDSLTSLTLPDSLTRINSRLFYSCIGLKTVEIGSAVTAIEDEAFFYCISLESIKIPPSVNSIGYGVFTYCNNITSVYSYPVNPPEVNELGMFFPDDVLENSILYVPFGTKTRYTSADHWKDFKNIVEMGEFSLETTTVTLEAEENSQSTVKLNSTLDWTASSDQEWLTVDPISGSGSQLLTLTAKTNPLGSERTAHVTISAQGMYPLTITITQQGLTVGIDALESPVWVKCYPNPFSGEMAIEIANPRHKEVNVDIYNISGQMVKNLARAQKGAKISLVWNGEDEKGKKMPKGIYLMKINEETSKVVKE